MRPDWLDFAILFALYLVASGVAPNIAILFGLVK